MNNISLLIHGVANRHWLEQIFEDIKKSSFSFKEIVIVSYISDLELYNEALEKSNMAGIIKLVPCKDVINPGFFNINRQLKTVKTGLEHISSDTYVIKLRNDQSVDFDKLLSYAKDLQEGAILSTNCYTRSDRLYHPSDMLLFGLWSDMSQYFSATPMSETHLDHMMNEIELYENSNGEVTALKITPESYLFRNYIRLKHWEILETDLDSLAAMKQYIHLVNSWDINYRWKESRTPYQAPGSIILPYYFTLRPFANGPLEKVACLNRHELYQQKSSLKDIYFILKSKLLFTMEYTVKGRKIRYKAKYKLLHLIKLPLLILPYFIVKNPIQYLNAKKAKAKEKYNYYQFYKR